MNTPIIHGKTRIELYDVGKRIKKVTESENTFQTAPLQKFFQNYGESSSNPFNNGDSNSGFNSRVFWANAVGGILLFKNAIEIPSGSSVNYMPAGNIMVGHGSWGVSNGSSDTDPTEMGSYNGNSSESTPADVRTGTSIKQTYEFTTAQGNGEIGCVCLTSRMGGLIGYGNSQYVKGRYSIIQDQSSRGIHDYNGAYYNNYMWSVTGISNGILTVRATRRTFEQGSIFHGFYKDYTFDLAEVGNPYNIVDGNGFHVMSAGGDKIRFITAHSRGTDYNNPHLVSSGGTLYYYEFDCTNKTLTLKTLLNSAPEAVYNSHASWNYDYFNCMITDKYYFGMNNYLNKTYIIDLETSTLLNVVEGQSSVSNLVGYTPHKLSDGLYTICKDYNDVLIWDSYNNTLKPIGLASEYIGEYNEILKTMHSTNGGMYKNPLYLATINNLQSPVTKTAAQTMKVVYTLTES